VASNIAAEICDSVAKPIAVAVLKVLSFAVIFFVCDFFLQIAAKAVCKLFELPVIRSVNRTLGGVFGALKGVFVAVFACVCSMPPRPLRPARSSPRQSAHPNS